MTLREPARGDRVKVEVWAEAGGTAAELETLRRALLEQPRRLPSHYFYDRRGSELFDEITRLEEYYPTRAERRLLESHAHGIAAQSGADTLVELGPGTATKTRILLDAMATSGRLRRYVPVDVSEATLRQVARELASAYPRLEIRGIVGNFVEHLERLPTAGGVLVIFLGGTIGNFTPGQARQFLRRLAAAMPTGGALLLGTDLIKDIERLERAYNDAAGVTAAFNRNILNVVNHRFRADFDPEAFRHRAVYDRARHRIEMSLVAKRPQRVRVAAIDLNLSLERGEAIRTEVSTKFDRSLAEALLDASGFALERWLTGPESLFALSLSRRR